MKPRPPRKVGVRRTYTAVRLGPAIDTIREMAEKETGGNVSAMIRKLLGEAITARLKLSK